MDENGTVHFGKMGRRLKGKSRRIRIDIYIDGDNLERLDNYVMARQRDEPRYSRGDYINAALEKYMKDTGLI